MRMDGARRARGALTVLARSWRFLLTVALIFGFAALLWCLSQKPVYEATTTLFASSGTNRFPTSAYEDTMGSQNRIGSYSKIVSSDSVLVPALKAAGLNMSLQQARDAVSSVATPETVVLTLVAQDTNPEVARRLANAVADSMIDRVSTLAVPIGGIQPTSRLTIVNQATVDRRPVSPATPVNVALAVILGLFAGVALVLGRERLNDTVRDEHDVERGLGARVLAQIPTDTVLKDARIVDFTGQATPAASAFRQLRTALSFVKSERPLRKILVTSPRSDDGKSTVALNLAAALAEGGHSVVLVDANITAPAIDTRIQGFLHPGLADALGSGVPTSAILQESGIARLKVVSAGRSPGINPDDLLSFSACELFFEELAQSFDYVIVDSAQLLDEPDAEAIACWADGVVLVARRGRSKLSDCDTAMARLSDIGALVIGVVLNDVRRGKEQHAAQPGHRAQRLDSRASAPANGQTAGPPIVIGG